MKTLLSISALLLTILLMQMGTTALGPLDALSAIQHGFSNTQIGIIGGAHFVGFIIGCFLSPMLVRRVGHARAYCVTAAFSIVAILFHPILPYFWAWCIFRIVTGIAIAASYTLVESWLNAKLTNKNRSRFFSLYRMSDMLGALTAQAMISVLVPAHFISYSVLAIIVCLSLIPLGLTKSVQPVMPASQKTDVLFAFHVSPLAALGVLVVGATSSAIRMIGPIFAYQLNFSPAEIGLFLSLPIVGGAIVQLPIGYLAEKFTPRQLLAMLSTLTIIISLGFNFIQTDVLFGVRVIYILVFVFGLTTMPIYSLCAIHAYNRIPERQMTMLSASLIFIFAISAIISPILTSYLIDYFGPLSMFTYFAIMHLILLFYTAYRSFIRPMTISVTARNYVYIPRTSLFITKTIKLLRRSKT